MGRQWLVFDLDGPRPGAVLHSVLHRVPRSKRISLTLAARLADRGVPSIGLPRVTCAVIICSCTAVDERTARACISAGARCPDDVAAMCGAGSQCGGCQPLVETLLAEVAGVDDALRRSA